MITNERQYRISKGQLAKLRLALSSHSSQERTRRLGSAVLAKAELDALRSEEQALTQQLLEYEALKSGAQTVLKVKNLEELPRLLIQGRIARGLSQRALANAIGLKEQQVQRYEAEEYASASLRRLAAVAEALKLEISEVAELRSPDRSASVRHTQKIDWELFPVREMYRRNWFVDLGFQGSLRAALAAAGELAQQYVEAAIPRRVPALLRQRARVHAGMDHYALLAWQCRVLLLARVVDHETPFSRRSLTGEWLQSLARESRFQDGPQRAVRVLREAGIPLVIEPHLPQTYLDGAAFLLPDGHPVIGLTLRYDRVDNFWFVLFHELFHVIKHLRLGELEDVFDDLDADPDDMEMEAESAAAAALIPDDAWETALARYLRTPETVASFADETGIHPAIVAGRIRKEAENYTILTNMVGGGQVRAQFPEVQFTP